MWVDWSDIMVYLCSLVGFKILVALHIYCTSNIKIEPSYKKSASLNAAIVYFGFKLWDC